MSWDVLLLALAVRLVGARRAARRRRRSSSLSSASACDSLAMSSEASSLCTDLAKARWSSDRRVELVEIAAGLVFDVGAPEVDDPRRAAAAA